MSDPFHTDRIAAITLDDASIIRRTPEVEHERRVAIADLLDENAAQLQGEFAQHQGPYALFISVRDGRLSLRFTDSAQRTALVAVPLPPFRGIIKDYFLMCEGYYEAIKRGTIDKIQTMDMARRAVHNEGSDLLREQLAHALALDEGTARRLFTLICVLHIK
ncbi:MAG: hypothetical protein DI582_02630 [Azospirillum brasilense]|nr:MAG: hypothetical protein DI582_02630 [Azospirillum brasilense]